MAGILDLLGLGGIGDGGGQDPNSRLALAASNDARAQPAAPATPEWGFGDPSQGNPLFGQQTYADDAQIDPDTGVSKGFLRRDSNKQALMTGLMLIAAGASRDDGARAQILSGLSNTMDSSSRIQNFAKMRLELAKARLADQQAKSSAAADAQFQSFLSGGTPAQGTAPAPAAPPAGPMAPVVGAQAAPAAAAVAAGTGNAADAAIAGAAASGAQPAAPQAPAAPAPAAPAPAAPSLLAGSGATMLPSKAPDKMDMPPEIGNFGVANLSAQQRQIIAGMGREKGLAEIERLSAEARNQEYVGSPIMMEGTNQVQIPIYQNGRLKGYKEAGAGTVTASIATDDQGNRSIQTKDARGNVTSITPTDLQSDKDAQRLSAADMTAAQAGAADLKTKYAGLADAGQKYARANQAISDIEAGKVDTGPASGALNYGKRLFDTFGQLSDEQKQNLLATDNVKGLEGSLVAKLAKANNGSQVTDADVRFAQSIVTGGGTPDEIKEALKRYQQDLRNEVNLYNDAANDHNSRIGGVKAGDYVKGGLKVKTVAGDFGTLGDANTPNYATPTSGAQQAPNAPTTPLGLLGRSMQGGSGQPAPIEGAPSAAGAAPPVTISDAAGYHKLPSGTHYIDPNGVARIKP
jgi:hypothetical protein